MSSLLKLANNAVGRLSVGINSAATTIPLTTGTGARFPSITGDEFFMATLIKVDSSNEIVKVTARTGDVLTVVRGQESTAPLEFLANDRVEARLTAMSLMDEFNRISTWIQSGIGAVIRAFQEKFREIPSVQDFGVEGDGATNDTVNFQKAIDAINVRGGGRLLVPAATYMLGRIYIKSNVTLVLESGAVLQAISSVFTTNQRFINFDDVSNVVIEGNHAVVRMNNEYSTGEQRHCVFMVDAHNVTINDLHADDSGGDGFYVGRNAAGTHCTNIKLNNCYADGNRRQGLSIVSGSGVTVIGGCYSGTDGTSPQYGIDIEPNDSNDEMIDIKLIGVNTGDNNGGGILVALQNLVLTADKTTSITITDCNSTRDNAAGVSGGAPLRICGTGSAWLNKLSGSVIVSNFHATDPEGTGIFIQDWDYQNAPRIIIDKVRITNPNASAAASQPFDQCGVTAFNFSGVVDTGNFSLNDIRVSGDNCYTTFYVYDTGGAVRNFTACDVIGEMSSTSSGFINYVSVAGPNPYGHVIYTADQIVDISSSSSVSNYPGHLIKVGASGVFDLPSGDTVLGQRFYFLNDGDYSAQINPQNAEFIFGWSLAAGDALIMNKKNDAVGLMAVAGGFSPLYVSRYAQRVGGYNQVLPSKVNWVNGVATTGARALGDLDINVTGGVGDPWAWTTSTSGSPGTQSPVGIIGAIQCLRIGTTSGATLPALETNLNAVINALITSKLMA